MGRRGGVGGILAQFIPIGVGPGTDCRVNAVQPGGAFPQMLWVVFIPTMWCALTGSVFLGGQRLKCNSCFK